MSAVQQRSRRDVRLLAVYAIAALSILLPAAMASSDSESLGHGVSPNDLVRGVVAKEVKSQDADHSRWMYRVNKEEHGKQEVKEVIQTTQGSLDRLLSLDGLPLNAEQQTRENERIERLANNAEEEAKLERAKKKDAEESERFFKMLPDALNFSYAGQEGDVIKLRYKPNPSFQPPSREARVFHAMEGEMWVQAKQQRLVRIRGEIIEEVKFGGGLLGHLEKGGHFNVEQTELRPFHWELTVMEVDMKGKALFFKTIDLKQSEHRSDFRPVPEHLTLSEAADMLTRQVALASSR